MAKRMALKLIPLITYDETVPIVPKWRRCSMAAENHYFYVLRCNDQSSTVAIPLIWAAAY